MTTDTTTDPELGRLLNVYALALYQTGVGGVGDPDGSIIDARAALLAHIAQHYVSREEIASGAYPRRVPPMSYPPPPGAVRLTLGGDPTPEQALKAGQMMLRLLREIERDLRARGEIAAHAPPIRWKLDMGMQDAD